MIAQPCWHILPKKGLAGSLLFIRRENIKQTTGWNYYIGLGLAGKRQEQAITNYISHIRRMGCTCHWAAHHQHYRHSPSSLPSPAHLFTQQPPLNMSHSWSRVHSVSVLIVSQSCAPLAEGGGLRGSSPMKRVWKQTFDIALFTAPAVRALERFMLYVSVIIYFICYMYTILWHLLSRRVHRSIYGMYTECVCPCVCVCGTHNLFVVHTHTPSHASVLK